MSSATQRLADRGLQLPPVPEPAAAYQPWIRVGHLVLTAGQLPIRDGVLAATGVLGRDLTTAEGTDLAELAALNVLAIADAALGGLEGASVVKVTVFVASDPAFFEQHLVADGASHLLADVLGDSGRHVRSAVGVASLPLNAPVEVEAILAG